MGGRYDNPAPKPLAINDSPYLLTDARPTLPQRIKEGEACEARRVEAVRDLLTLARAEVRKADTAEPPSLPGHSRLRAMPLQLRDFLEIEGLRILLSDEPVEALRRFLGQQPRKRGREAVNTHRDFAIAISVAMKHQIDEMSVEKACIEVAREAELSLDAVHKIYYRRDKARVGWELAFRIWLLGPKTGT